MYHLTYLIYLILAKKIANNCFIVLIILLAVFVIEWLIKIFSFQKHYRPFLFFNKCYYNIFNCSFFFFHIKISCLELLRNSLLFLKCFSKRRLCRYVDFACSVTSLEPEGNIFSPGTYIYTSWLGWSFCRFYNIILNFFIFNLFVVFQSLLYILSTRFCVKRTGLFDGTYGSLTKKKEMVLCCTFIINPCRTFKVSVWWMI